MTLRNKQLRVLVEAQDWDELLEELVGIIHRLVLDGRLNASIEEN
jgi:hypothetical protein